MAIVPARYHSSRLPGKPLADIDGRPMVEHVYRRAAQAHVDAVIVATDDQRIVEAVERFGGIACLTRADHLTGTDRLAELVADLPCDIVDQRPGRRAAHRSGRLDTLVAPLLDDPGERMTTLCRPLAADEDVGLAPSGQGGARPHRARALLLPRADSLPRATASAPPPAVHIGLYAYRRDTLLALAALPPTPLERSESLEQLRALEHGIPIRVLETAYVSIAVDTPDDLERARRTVSQS